MKIKPLEFKETYNSAVKTCWEAKGVTYKYEITETNLGFSCIAVFSKDIQNKVNYPTFQQASDFCDSENLKDFNKVIESCENVKNTWILKQLNRKIKYKDGKKVLFIPDSCMCQCGNETCQLELESVNGEDIQYAVCDSCGLDLFRVISHSYDFSEFKWKE